MKLTFACAVLLALGSSSAAIPQHPSLHSSPTVKKLLSSLTLEEKVGQMLQIDISLLTNPGGDFSLNKTLVDKYFNTYKVGSVLNSPFSGGPTHADSTSAAKYGWTPSEWRAVISSLQDASLSSLSSGVPLLYGIDSIHGASYAVGSNDELQPTLFPQQIGLAATFNRELANKQGLVTAQDTLACGIPWMFSPILDLAVNPLWARFWETFGEDSYLASEMAASIVNGLQGLEPDTSLGTSPTAACVKHFIGYSGTISGHDRTESSQSSFNLRQTFLPPYEAAVRSGALTAMESYHEISGEAVVQSAQYLGEGGLLRREAGFGGMLVTDWREIANLVEFHGAAPNYKDAIRRVMERTTVDMSMSASDATFAELLVELVKEGAIPVSRIDKSVERILKLKESLGLFEKPYPRGDVKAVGSAADQSASLNSARESITLLKNSGSLLPLSPETRVLVVGPSCADRSLLNGGWTYAWQGTADGAFGEVGTSILSGLRSRFEHVEYVKGVELDGSPAPDAGSLTAFASSSDVVVACIGEGTYTEKPGDISDLHLPSGIVGFMSSLPELCGGLPVVTVLVEGRPRLLEGIPKLSDALLHAYLPGPHGGQAVAEIIAGEVNPSGRIPFTYPKMAGDVRPYYRRLSHQCIDQWKNIVQCEVEFEFGEGLSYSTFSYSDISVEAVDGGAIPNFRLKGGAAAPGLSKAGLDEVVATVKVTVTNQGPMAGMHSALVFLFDSFRTLSPEYKLLKKFEKVTLDVNESVQLTFGITRHDVSFVDVDDARTVEEGRFLVGVGYDADCRKDAASPLCGSFDVVVEGSADEL